MNAGYELPLPAAQIVDRLNHRQRIPLTPWSLRVTSVSLVPRPERVPLVELTVEVSAAGSEGGASSSVTQRWAVRFLVRGHSLEPGAPAHAFILLLRIDLEDWWLNRTAHPSTQAHRLDPDRPELALRD
ncbi:hypothetical protein [Kineosporia babensis]|uniref:Uncharacterized protein n=1 Tax=Kineosporia babensis TaxID=499548 RepID=A0A9X1NGR1_9ACTN|nr:hypothetical protein [Kineosporia babensis]MCD5314737.1 hypothetical protein [Kineosporia babensis]